MFEEYGFPFAESDYDADLMDPATHYDGERGWFAVAEDATGEVVGCVGLTDEGDGLFELHRLYVLAEARRGGTGSALVQWVLDRARERGATRIVLFSDVRSWMRTGCTGAWAFATIASATRPTRGNRANGALSCGFELQL